MEDLKILNVRMPPETHQQLRKIAYLTEQPMAELIRQGLEIVLSKNKKLLTIDDTAI